MKWSPSYRLSFGILAILLSGSVPAFTQTNLLKNPGFEEGQNDSAAVWQVAKPQGKNGRVERSNMMAHSGRFSIHILPNVNNRGSSISDDPIGVGQGFPARDFLGKTVTISAWLAARGGATATVALYAIGSSGPRFVELNQASSEGGMAFQTSTLEIPSRGVDYLVVLPIAKGNSGEVFIDDISLSIGATAPALSRSAPERGRSEQASISVNATRVIREIPRGVFGTNIEWIWDGNGLWDTSHDRLNEQLLGLTRELRPTLIRFPGGIFSDFYHWRDGIGPRAQRVQTAHSPSGGESVHRFGTDEALEFASRVGGELLITVNLGTGTAEEAADWVRYVNSKGRRVTYWEVGNEIYVKDNSPHSRASTMPPDAYADKFIQFSRAMKAADPGIKVGALGEENYGNSYKSYQNWTETVLRKAGADMDFIAVHNGYAPAIATEDNLKTEDVYRAMLAAPAQIRESLQELSRKIDRMAPQYASRIKIAVTEWGPYFEVTPSGKWVDHPKTLASALYIGSALKTFIEEPKLEIANAFKLVDPLYMGWIGKRGSAYIPQASYFATQMFVRHLGNRLLESKTAGPGFDAIAVGWVRAAKDVPYLDTLASRSPDGKTVYVTVVNKNLDQAVTSGIEIAGFQPRPEAKIWTLNGDSPDANTGSELFQAPGVRWAKQAEYERGGQFSKGGPDAVKLTSSSFSDSGPAFQYTFPAHSITTFELNAK